MSTLVSFTRMEDGTREDYELLDRAERDYARHLPATIMAALRKLDHSLEGYPVSRLGHSLQAATRALRADADQELIYLVAGRMTRGTPSSHICAVQPEHQPLTDTRFPLKSPQGR